MKIVPVDELPYYSRLGQNIYRHDGLLALPRGITLKQKELDEIRYHGIDFVLVYDKRTPIGNEKDISFTLNIIQHAYTKTTLWELEFGEKLYEFIHKQVQKNEKISGILNELRMYDSYSFAHCINISIIVVSLLKKSVRDVELLKRIAFISLLHDVGRLNMAEIFNKEGKLTEQEYEELKKHPEESYKILKKAGFVDEDVSFVSETHEKFNGTGYPFRLKGNNISDLGQLILIADVYNALSSFRPYRDVYDPYEVSKMIEEETERAFNSRLVKLFRENFEPYKKGMQVELSDGRMAFIKTTVYSKTLPVISVVSEDTGEVLETIDLSTNKTVRIKRITTI